MTLCDLCKTIPLDGLPAFPDEDIARSLSGLTYFHQFFLRTRELESVGFKHHSDLQSLRAAAAAGCGLCRLIESQADCILADIDGLGEERRGPFECQPQFDLWLTTLPNGRAGFLVLTNGKWERKSAVCPMAAIGFCAEEDNPLATVFKARPLPEIPDYATLNRVAGWVTACDAEGHSSIRGKTTPARLIGVGSSDSGNTIRIVNASNDTVPRYVALSHCYKHRDIAQADLLPASQESVDLTSLPKTFQDAIAVTRVLGEKYLWVDEVCIAKEDVQDWARNSANVASVFTNAYLTLAATGASDTSKGLFLPRRREYVRIDHATAGLEGHILAFTLPLNKEVIDSYYVDMASEPLIKEVWAFQDRVLSPRSLHFASDQIYLECQGSFISEDGLRLSYDRLHFASRFDGIPQDKNKAKTAWYGLLWAYGRLFPENTADKLPAMANVARAYGEIMRTEYIAGFWKDSVIESLAWQSLRRKDIHESSAPSWSWASFGGIPAAGFIDGWEKWVPCAKLLDHHIELEGSDPFGGVNNSSIKLECSLVPLELCEKQGPMGHMLLKTPNAPDGMHAGFDLLPSKYDESADTIKGTKLSCLILGFTTPLEKASGTRFDKLRTCYRCLIVAPTEDGESMKRLGYLLASDENFSPEELESRTVVTLR